jgi:septum formation protein
MPSLVLASASPRRQELLHQAGFPFTVQPADVDETPGPDEGGIALAIRLAQSKSAAAALAEKHALTGIFEDLSVKTGQPDEINTELVFLGADTVVVAPSGEILGKPVDDADAARMLTLLSGGTHQVITGVCVHVPHLQQTEVAASLTWVSVHSLSAAEIAAYVATGESHGKAGAYAIQGRFARSIPYIHGDYSNVVGLPLALVAAMLAPFGITPA